MAGPWRPARCESTRRAAGPRHRRPRGPGAAAGAGREAHQAGRPQGHGGAGGARRAVRLRAAAGGRPVGPGRAPGPAARAPRRAGRLFDAGVRFALAAPPGSGRAAPAGGAGRPRQARRRGRPGLVTRVAAEVLGVVDRVGTLTPGRDADLVLLTGDPLGTRSEVVETWVGGRLAWRAPTSSAVVVRAGTVLTLAGEALRDGEVLIEGGRIAAVGSSVPHPRGARVIVPAATAMVAG
ncbi:MAG: amidohydrolase family protein [Planctomycetota bacterium]|nr:amidohydrolase family protein [Planctomycetota bacterium]